MKLTDFKSGGEFQSFCNLLFHSAYPKFQSFDDSGGDLGIDGYIPSEKIFACYFPDIDKLSKSDYKSKIKKDLKRVAETIKQEKLSVKEWIFVTPRDLATDVTLFLRNEASKYNLEGISYGASKLTQLIAEHPKVISQFPNIAFPDIKKDTGDIKNIAEGIDSKLQAVLEKLGIKVEGVQRSVITLVDVLDDKNIRKSFEHWGKAEMKEAYKYANDAYHKSSGHVKLQAIINMVLTTEEQVQKATYFGSLCQEGIELAIKLNDFASVGILKAHKAFFLHHKMFETSMQIYAEIRYRQVGYGIMSQVELSSLLNTVQKYAQEAERLIKEGQEDAIKSKNYSALAHIKITIGLAVGLSYFLPKQMGLDTGDVEQYTVRSILEAKEIYEQLSDKEGVANALHNLANNLRFFGDFERAKEYAKQALTIAKEIGYKELEVKGKELLEDRLSDKQK